MLTHSVLAGRQGYPSIPTIFAFNESFTKKEHPPACPHHQHPIASNSAPRIYLLLSRISTSILLFFHCS